MKTIHNNGFSRAITLSKIVTFSLMLMWSWLSVWIILQEAHIFKPWVIASIVANTVIADMAGILILKNGDRIIKSLVPHIIFNILGAANAILVLVHYISIFGLFISAVPVYASIAYLHIRILWWASAVKGSIDLLKNGTANRCRSVNMPNVSEN